MKSISSVMIMFGAIAAADVRAGEIDLAFCLDPLVLKTSFETPYKCDETQDPYSSPGELREILGDPGPVGFCVGPLSGTGFTACTDACSVDSQSGCYGMLRANELSLNPTDSRICGNYSIEIADIDVHVLGVSCSLALVGTGGMVNELESTYPSRLTWQIDASHAQFSNVDLEFSGCGTLGPVLDAVTDTVGGLIEGLVAGLVNDGLTNDGGLRVCPVDSLRLETIPAPP